MGRNIKSQFVEMFGDPMKNPMGWDKCPMGNHISLLTDFSANGSYELLDHRRESMTLITNSKKSLTKQPKKETLSPKKGESVRKCIK